MVGLAAKMARVLDTLDPANFKHKRWRDRRGVVHDLEAIKVSGLSSGVTWVSLCGRHEPSINNCVDPKTPITCIMCLGREKPVHDDDCVLYCELHDETCERRHDCDLCGDDDGVR